MFAHKFSMELQRGLANQTNMIRHEALHRTDESFVRQHITIQPIRALVVAFILFTTIVPALAATQRQTNVIEGWTVLVDERLLAENKAATEKALGLLRGQLKEIVRVVPAPAVAKLREVTLWFSPEYAGVRPRAEYHPGAGWLRDNGRDPAMVKGVEFTDVKSFEAESRRMPNFTLHELAHAYHDRVLPRGFNNAEIKTAFERAKAGKSYDKVERWFGNGALEYVRARLCHDRSAGVLCRDHRSLFLPERFLSLHA
jgi:hypothetical protein